MKTEQILMCIVSLILGMLIAGMLKNICGCKIIEGYPREHVMGQMQGLKWNNNEHKGNFINQLNDPAFLEAIKEKRIGIEGQGLLGIIFDHTLLKCVAGSDSEDFFCRDQQGGIDCHC